jgi:hypothetical protein
VAFFCVRLFFSDSLLDTIVAVCSADSQHVYVRDKSAPPTSTEIGVLRLLLQVFAIDMQHNLARKLFVLLI